MDVHEPNSGQAAISTPYRVANLRIDYRPCLSPLLQGSYRALAATANNFARESQIDELAHLLGRDPLEFRLRNVTDDRLATVLQAAAERFGWTAAGAGQRTRDRLRPREGRSRSHRSAGPHPPGRAPAGRPSRDGVRVRRRGQPEHGHQPD